MAMKYQMLADNLRREITERSHPEGSRLPTEQELTRRFGVSRQTVRQALALLMEEGLIEKRQGSGTFISRAVTTPAASSRSIAILTPYTDSGVPAGLWKVQSLLSDAGYRSQVFSTENRFGREREILESLLASPVRGILASGVRTACPNPNLDLYRRLLESGAAMVFLGTGYPELSALPQVCPDDFQGGYLLTEHLLSLGHTKIGGVFRWDDRGGQQRFHGCLCCLRDRGISFDDRRFLWLEGVQSPAVSGLHPLRSFIQSRLSDCTAVICQEEETAGLLLQELASLGIRVPEHLSLAAFSHSLPAKPYSLPITTASPDERNPWAMAAQGLLQIINGRRFAPETIPWVIQQREHAGTFLPNTPLRR